MCCSGGMQGPLSCVLQLVRVRARSRTPVTLGLVLEEHILFLVPFCHSFCLGQLSSPCPSVMFDGRLYTRVLSNTAKHSHTEPPESRSPPNS